MKITAQMLATALRDLTTAVLLNSHGEHPEEVWRATEYVEALLTAFVDQEGDILPTYLPIEGGPTA